MPYNPITGEFDYGGESYNAPTAGIGMTMAGMGAVGADIPLAFRVMENMPGISAMAMHNARRYSNTMFRGGFLDVAADASRGKIARAKRLGGTVGGVPQAATSESFLFGSRRFAGGVPAGKTPLFKQSRVTNFTARPRIFNRMGSVTQLVGDANKGFYTPFQSGSFLESMFGKRVRQRAIASGALPAGSDQKMFSGGVLGRMSTMSRAYSLERRETQLLMKGTESANKRAAKIGAKLSGLDRNTAIMDSIANPLRTTTRSYRIPATSGYGGLASGSTANLKMSMPLEMRQQLASAQRLRAISDTSSGVISRGITEYMGTMLDPTQFKGTRAYAALEQNIKKALYYADGATDLAGKKAAATAAKSKAAQFMSTGYVDDVGRFGVRSLAGLSKSALASGQRAVGAKLAAATGARALGLAMPGLNVIGTASLVYDLTKLGAMGIVSAGNFAKDAVKSMQGSLHKPLFGMGFQDNEVSATSRARGVMAIQNSRLNARSMLGSEASMMAAHFG